MRPRSQVLIFFIPFIQDYLKLLIPELKILFKTGIAGIQSYINKIRVDQGTLHHMVKSAHINCIYG